MPIATRARTAKPPRPRSILALLAFLLPLAAGCGRAESAASSDEGIALRDRPRPLAFTATADTAARGRGVIVGASGGTVEASTDRVVYRLVVPPNAIAGVERITVTPLSAAGGLPAGAPLAAGVRLEPEGLRFLEPVTLEIVPVAEESFGDVRALASRGDGADLHLYPATVGDGAVTLDLVHFSDYVLAGNGAAAAREAAQRPPAGAEAQFEQRLAMLIGDEKARPQAAGDAPDGPAHGAALTEKMLAEFRDHWTRVVHPKLLAATTDDALATDAITGYLAWRRRAQLLIGGTEEKNAALFAAEDEEAAKLMRRIVRNAFEKAAGRCERSADFFQFHRMLGIARSAQLLGMGDLLADADEKLDRCTSFELVFESTTTQDAKMGDFLSGFTRHRVRATVPLAFDWKTGRLHGEAPLENLESTVKNFHGLGTNCVSNSTSQRGNGTFTVFDGAVNLDRLNDSTKSDAAPNVVLFVDPSRPKVALATRCGSLSLPVTLDDSPYPWSDFHRKEEVHGELQDRFQAAELWEITDWEPGPPGVIARKVYDRAWDTPGTHHVEHSVLELRRPVAAPR